MEPPPRPKNLHLYRLSPLIHASETSILHIVAGCHCVALATSINTLLLHRSGRRHGRPPITLQVQWFAGDLKGIASMAMRDDADFVVATHDASAFVLPLRFMLRRPPAADQPNASTADAAVEDDDANAIAPSCAELVAVHGGDEHASVSCCTLCELGGVDGVAAAIGSLDGTVHIVSLTRRCLVGRSSPARQSRDCGRCPMME